MTAATTPPIEGIRALLRKALELTDCPRRNELLAQVEGVEYVDGPVTMMNLRVDGARPAAADALSPVRISPSVLGDDGEVVGGLLLWLDDSGYISCLEYWWVTDEMPMDLPLPDRLVT